MIRMDMAAVADAVGGTLVDCPDPSALVTGAAADSRLVVAGDLYVAIAGERVDGHDFAVLRRLIVDLFHSFHVFNRLGGIEQRGAIIVHQALERKIQFIGEHHFPHNVNVDSTINNMPVQNHLIGRLDSHRARTYPTAVPTR